LLGGEGRIYPQKGEKKRLRGTRKADTEKNQKGLGESVIELSAGKETKVFGGGKKRAYES